MCLQEQQQQRQRWQQRSLSGTMAATLTSWLLAYLWAARRCRPAARAQARCSSSMRPLHMAGEQGLHAAQRRSRVGHLQCVTHASFAEPLVMQCPPTNVCRVHGGADLLSTFGDRGLMFALDQGGTSYRGTSQASSCSVVPAARHIAVLSCTVQLRA